LSAAAAKVTISERTLRKWLQLPWFRDEYRKAGRRALATASVNAQSGQQRGGLLLGAVQALVGDGNRFPGGRIDAPPRAAHEERIPRGFGLTE